MIDIPSFSFFKQKVEEHGLVAHDCGNNHWQIKGGKLLVNYYPQRGTIHINGMCQGTKGKIRQAIEAAISLPQIGVIPPTKRWERQTKRWVRNKKNRARFIKNVKKKRKVKALLHRASPHCYWCQKPLTLEEATLEHIIPIARGGGHSMSNLTLACKEHNTARGCDMPEFSERAHYPGASVYVESVAVEQASA